MPELPDCVTEADTLDEMSVMLKDAITGYLEVASENDNAVEFYFQMQIAV